MITTNVITSGFDDPIEIAARRMETHYISALPVVDEHQRVIGVVNSEGIHRLVGYYWTVMT
ncbi:MAG: CBS domain-containing protein [Euryarchaeota archaeon]|nr:CBS domain-containing protein [Euryarchaeota archaeon]